MAFVVPAAAAAAAAAGAREMAGEASVGTIAVADDHWYCWYYLGAAALALASAWKSFRGAGEGATS